MGFVRRTDPEAQDLSRELRNDSSGTMQSRRAVVGLSMLGAASLGVVALYQTGITKHLPEPDWPHFDAEKVDASGEAYEWLSTPDAVLGIGSYGATMALAAMGARDRAREQPYILLALAAKVAFDVVNAVRLTRDQWTKHRVFCIWCLIAAGATFATLPFTLPEAFEAIRNLKAGTRFTKQVREAA